MNDWEGFLETCTNEEYASQKEYANRNKKRNKRHLTSFVFSFVLKDIVINTGSEMVVAIAGDIIRMPGLPKVPQATKIDIINGEIEGLS